MDYLKPTTLEGTHIRLVPLTLSHHSRLCEIGLDDRLWRFTTIRVETPEDMLLYVQTALDEQSLGNCLPFVIVEKRSGQIIGTTRYHSINKAHARLEIGFTWIAPPWQRTTANIEAKYLLLKRAFEEIGCVRVEFKADCSNEQSCQALLGIGAKQEGILRNYVVSNHKGTRNLALFSVIDSDWPEVRDKLETKLRGQGPSLQTPRELQASYRPGCRGLCSRLLR